jgi:hypothetical protein
MLAGAGARRPKAQGDDATAAGGGERRFARRENPANLTIAAEQN